MTVQEYLADLEAKLQEMADIIVMSSIQLLRRRPSADRMEDGLIRLSCESVFLERLERRNVEVARSTERR